MPPPTPSQAAAGQTEGAPPAQPGDADQPELSRAAVASDAGRFAVESILGIGANGRVYAVQDRDLERTVAMKVLVARDAGEVERFLDEARITASLSHPNVLPVLDIDRDGRGRPYFTMPKIEGRSLATILEQSTFAARAAPVANLNAVVSALIAVCQATSYAHRRGIVHQDIKPENVMVGELGEVLLVDWGSAVRLDAPGEQSLYGTPLYMSPEQARRERVDRRSDVYAIGATLFHALALRPPTWADDPEEFWRKKRAGVVDAPSEAEEAAAPAALLAIALKAMAAQPDARYPDAEAMLGDLRAYQGGLAISAYRDTVRAALMRWYHRNRRAVWTGAVACVALAVVASLFAAEKAKEQASWHPVYTRFPASIDRLPPEWSAQWMSWWQGTLAPAATDDPARFAIDGEGALHVHGPVNGWIDVAFGACPLGPMKVEWDYRSPDIGTDLNCFIGGPNRMACYTFHVGGWGNPSYIALTKGESYDVLDSSYLPEPLAQNRAYHFSLEKDGGRLHLEIDGRVVFDYLDPASIYGDTPNTFGFDCCNPVERVISHISIWHKPLPQRISPLAIGDKLLQLGDHEHAEAQFADLERSYPGSDIAKAAQFRRAVCELRAGHDEAGVRLLEQFAKDHPGDDLIPYGMYERLQVARNHRHDDVVLALREQFAAYRGHPLLRMVLTQIAEEHIHELDPLPVQAVSDPIHAPGTDQVILATSAELRRWGELYGVRWWANSYCFRSWRVLEIFGCFRQVVELFPTESTQANQSRLAMGLYDEVVRLTTEPYQRALAMEELGRGKELSGQMFWQSKLEQDGPAAVADDPACDVSVRGTALARLGRYDEVLRDHRANLPLETEALVALGRLDEIDRRDPVAAATELLERGRFDELASRYPMQYELQYRSALRQLRAGRVEQARELLAQLQRTQMPLNDDSIAFARNLFPCLLSLIAGEETDVKRALAPVIESRRWFYGQRQWHLARYIVGEIDDAGFTAQPCKRMLDQRLAWARALRADATGHAAEAAAAYRAILDSPRMRMPLYRFEADFARWRVAVASGETPAAP